MRLLAALILFPLGWMLPGCAEPEDAVVLELENADGKADGKVGFFVTLSPEHPAQEFRFRCDEWFTCDFRVSARITSDEVKQSMADWLASINAPASSGFGTFDMTITGPDGFSDDFTNVISRSPDTGAYHESATRSVGWQPPQGVYHVTLRRQSSYPLDAPVPDRIEYFVSAAWH